MDWFGICKDCGNSESVTRDEDDPPLLEQCPLCHGEMEWMDEIDLSEFAIYFELKCQDLERQHQEKIASD